MIEYMWIIWLVIFVLALLIEAIGPEIVSIWFAGGALVSLIISFIPGVDWWVQLIVFAVVSAALLVFIRPFLAKALKTRDRESQRRHDGRQKRCHRHRCRRDQIR